MKDLFERESEVLRNATQYLESVQDKEVCSKREYAKLLQEYARILKLIRRVTKISDKTTVELNDDKINLMNQVHYDALTGIFNRRYFEEESERIILECQQNGSNLGVLIVDVDFFKQYNDTYGHSHGDECLQKIAKILKESMNKKEGFVARYGGEEFIAVLPNADNKEVSLMAENMLQNIRNQKIKHEKNADRGYVTVSIGGVSRKNVSLSRLEEYVNNADAALYRSKQTGRDKFTLQIFEGEERCW